MDRVRWEYSPTGRAYCTDWCIPSHKRSGRDTPCGIPPEEDPPTPRPGPGPCPNQPPTITPENALAWQAWGLVADQWRAGLEIIGYDLPGATVYLDHLGLADPETLVKLRAISNVVFEEMRARREERRMKK